MRVVLIDAGGANIGSVRYALQRLGIEAALTGDAAQIRAADRVILPGVGAAAPAMARLREHGLVETIRTLHQPLLGICLGMQLLFEASEEGDVETLGRLPGRVARLQGGPGLRIPHIGWNRLALRQPHPLMDGIDDGARTYFVHSYAVPVTSDCIAACTYGETFAAVVARGNVCGAQFHPERSAGAGARLLANFVRMGVATAAAA
jgi:imidazole glycerol-phosphate synthase subunit HisH